MAADITVVIPARNAAATLDAALGSLTADRPVIREILVIDDGSDDRTAEVAMESARRLGLPLDVVSVRLGSAGAARNLGIERASGTSIFFLDADDEVMPGSLSLLGSALAGQPGAGLAVGASIRRAKGRPDKLKTPHGYVPDRRQNTRRYLRNELWPIAMGSALVADWATAGIRFPETIGLDEDTCYWAALLARAEIVAIDTPVLLYHHDEERMARRFITAPRKTFLAIARELDSLAAAGIERDALQWRKAWIAQRIARQLVKHGMFVDAAGMMRAVKAHRELGRSWKAAQYRARIRFGRLAGIRPDTAAGSAAPRRTLIVSFDPAYPPASGADLRTFGNAVAAAAIGPVRLASVRPAGSTQPPGRGIRVVSLTTEADKRSHSLGWRRIKGENRIPRPALARLKALAREFRPDTIVVESVPLFKLLQPLRPLTSRLILDMHNVESDLAAQTPGNAPSAVSPEIRQLERRAATIVDRIWVCSKLDRERLKTIITHETPVDIVPNGIPRAQESPRTLPPSPGTSDGFPVILFVGHLGYHPNIDAAERLARIILPRVRQALPSARLVLAGRSPDRAVRALSELDSVVLIENPDDVGPLLSAAHLCIVPLRTGGGTRIKILEAMAAGVPVIATPLAAEGLDVSGGEDLLLSDTDEGLADLTVALCSDPARMARLRARAYDTAWSRFGPQAIRDAVRHGLGLDGASR
ncbi:glycosyltransferase [Mesorhizobium sp. M2D.F.Ca.ET.185.01.1.1]|uniref:glycosyltransferase n=3 Tax=Mesorhizobium TaxID=68287 RepID=UPI000FC9A809|nr:MULTISPECIES: glycosyltransferase [unclassified Mesorhizobium]TGP82294.1 glycosyltransferase [bacterium M00.F.Ca.ET.227.01.1.1]TGP91821.1 glycosyltransferase [bacterium M00.F.Ca.ET.221.01.1.1]TGP95392.1 glycosyltransferase [bacterium M00.F.Ca.ET.222.01.1.1]TGU03613.1 glycosyltransferase [bacterium M00.F.Ca.ET.163.01.1.1]TGU38678.1 glycosyltransferase [bacterium M00.F.Ca.ET.156.01.1.1]TGU47977.1 glycosyltransferase [bacterium M00.F.Ca.ET.146.01.1.1]TGV66321.1 glycosyltransferase [Mesorhizo